MRSSAIIITRSINLGDFVATERAYEGIHFSSGVIVLSDLKSRRMMTFFSYFDMERQFNEKTGYKIHLIKRWDSDKIRIPLEAK